LLLYLNRIRRAVERCEISWRKSLIQELPTLKVISTNPGGYGDDPVVVDVQYRQFLQFGQWCKVGDPGSPEVQTLNVDHGRQGLDVFYPSHEVQLRYGAAVFLCDEFS
jgi:hypothetical protein